MTWSVLCDDPVPGLIFLPEKHVIVMFSLGEVAVAVLVILVLSLCVCGRGWGAGAIAYVWDPA